MGIKGGDRQSNSMAPSGTQEALGYREAILLFSFGLKLDILNVEEGAIKHGSY